MNDVPESFKSSMIVEDGWCSVSLVVYSIQEGEVATTPEVFNFKRIAKYYCKYFPPGSEYAVEITTYSGFNRKVEWYDWNALQNF